MAEHSSSNSALDSGWSEQEQLLEAFELAWRQGRRPTLEDFLPVHPAQRSAVLPELVRSDLEFRIKAGEAVHVQDYLERYPTLAMDRRAVLDLIQTEFRWRKQQDASITWADQISRYPEYRQELSALSDHADFAHPDSNTGQGQKTTPPGDQTSDPNATDAEAYHKGLSESTVAGKLPNVPGYEILGTLGRGGMGVVYKARQAGLKRLVALKMIRSGHTAGREEIARFRAEAEAVAQLQHPNIVQVFEVGEYKGEPYFSLEFVEGGSLDKKLKGEPQPIAEAARTIEVLGRAVHAAHERGIIHRDLKPANVLLAADGVLKITDFGLAKRLDMDGEQTASGGTPMGTPLYMAPEQAEGRAADIGPATDVYALGAMLYELLTGRPPFRGVSIWETLALVCRQEPVPPSRLQPKVPVNLETICLKCLQKDPARRYASGTELADDLRRFQAGEPIRARPVGRLERAWKWARRYPVAAALFAVSALALLSTSVGAVLFALMLQQDADAAVREAKRKQTEAERLLKEEANLSEKKGKLQEHFSAGKAHFDNGDWAAARVEFTTGRTIQDNHGIELLRDEVKDYLSRAEAALADGKALAEFDALRLEALVQGLSVQIRPRQQVMGPDGELQVAAEQDAWGHDATLGRARETARKALTKLGLEGQGPSILGRDYLSTDDKVRLADRSYELYLILAEAEGQPRAGETAAGQVAKAVAVLEQAKALRATQQRTPGAAWFRFHASFLGELGDREAADRAEKNAEKATTDTAVEHFLEGFRFYQQKDYAAARGSFEKALNKDADHFSAQFMLGASLLSDRRPAEAVARLSACLAKQPDFVWIRLYRGTAYSELGAQASFGAADDKRREKEAKDHFETALGDFADAEKMIKGANAARDDDAAKYSRFVLFVNRGVLRLRQKQYGEAQQQFMEAGKLRPEAYQVHLNLAKAYELEKQFDKALEELDKAIQRKPSNVATIYRARAKLHFAAEPPNLDAALGDLQAAIANTPPGQNMAIVANDHYLRARVLERKKQFAEALAEAEQARQHLPGWVLPDGLSARLLFLLNRKDEALPALNHYLELANRRLEQFLDAREPVAEFYWLRGSLFAGQRDGRSKARADYDRALGILAISKQPNPKLASEILSARGWIFTVSNVPTLAFADFKEAVKLNDKNAHAHSGLGWCLVQEGKHKEGTDAMEAALKQAERKDDTRLLFNAARTYAQAMMQIRLPAKSRPQDLEEGKQLRLRYQSSGIHFLNQAVQSQKSSKEQEKFWREVVKEDVALAPLRTHSEYTRLEQTILQKTGALLPFKDKKP